MYDTWEAPCDCDDCVAERNRTLFPFIKTTLQQLKTELSASQCTEECTCLKNLLLKIQFYQSLYDAFVENTLDRQCVMAAYDAYVAYTNEIVNDMLFENRGPNMYTYDDNDEIVTYDDKPSEMLRSYSESEQSIICKMKDAAIGTFAVLKF